MARFLFTVWPFPGHFFPTIAMAYALRERGHTVAFYSGTAARQVVKQEGFECFPFTNLDEQRLKQVMFSPEYRSSLPLKRMLRRQAMYHAWLVETLPMQLADLEAIIAAWQPDVLATDPTMWAPIAILHDRDQIPVVVASFVPACMLPAPDMAPFGFGLPRPRSKLDRIVARVLTRAADIAARKVRRAVNAERQHHGLVPLTMPVTAYAGHMPLYLVPSVPEFDYQRRDLPPSVHYVGPCLWNRPQHEPSAEWLADLPRNQPWIHVSEGTVHVDRPLLLRAVAQALKNMPFQVIMTTGGNRNPEDIDLGPPMPNIHVVRWVPHSELLPHTALVITTGGAGTVLAALAAGIPLIVVPTEWEKPENAQRVVEAGAGLRLTPRQCTSQHLRLAVEQVLGDPSFRRQARQMATHFARYGGAAQAAKLMEQSSIGRVIEDAVVV